MLCGGTPVALPPKALKTLLLLVQNSGRVVTKENLMNEIWPGIFVEESNLTQNIFTLRKALGEGRRGQKYIETMTKRGYRFAIRVREVCGKDDAAFLAILPLVNAASDPSAEYLCDGITETIINNLSQLHHLRVMAYNIVSRYKGRNVDLSEVARDLNVQAVLCGSVLRLDDQIIIRVELVDVASGTRRCSTLWGEHYNYYNDQLSDIFAVERNISEKIVEKLRLLLSGAQGNTKSLAT